MLEGGGSERKLDFGKPFLLLVSDISLCLLLAASHQRLWFVNFHSWHHTELGHISVHLKERFHGIHEASPTQSSSFVHTQTAHAHKSGIPKDEICFGVFERIVGELTTGVLHQSLPGFLVFRFSSPVNK